MSDYKTPGVYVQEISTLPPSVAAVETAIPAFIGYTERAQDLSGANLLNVPVKISSMVDFREKFGGQPPVTIDEISLNSLLEVTSISMINTFYLYDSLQMFFANGGGDCYIVSVGKFGDTIQNGDEDGPTQGFLAGLKQLEKADEPTLVLAPDAVLMTQANLNSLYQKFLSHCSNLKDRFSLFDLKENNGSTFQKSIDDFRIGIGVSSLNYGAAYTSWLKSNLPRIVNFKDIRGHIYKSGAQASLMSLVEQTNLEARFTAGRLDNLVQDAINIDTLITSLRGVHSSLQEAFSKKYHEFLNMTTSADKKAKMKTLFELYLNTVDFFDTAVDPTTGFKDKLSAYSTYPTSLTSGKTYLFDSTLDFLNDPFRNTVAKLRDYIAEANTQLGGFAPSPPTWRNEPIVTIFGQPGVAVNVFTTGANNLEKMNNAAQAVANLWTEILSGINLILANSSSLLQQLEDSATQQIPVYKKIKDKIASELVLLPPSGAIAGIYARTDATRGVWKAPANVSLNLVNGVKENISFNLQESLNIDVVGGKSINAIRAFPGKGILVWGARTLAGNDNEWRYISVRRFFIFAEESIKKAIEQFVFEPNVEDTWIKVKGAIQSFLTDQWKAGALAGATPQQAFFVSVGLGQTMTAQDILEGRMIVEVGMAASRPAEFIILKFSHKLQET